MLDNTFFNIESHWHLAVAYIHPENSNYHLINDVDIFKQTEEDSSFYKTKASIALLGDLNSRIGRKCDYIENDEGIDLEFEYISGTTEPWNPMDRTLNRYGEYLLQLCKAVNIQCHNGRSELDTEGRFTCMTHAGESVVDYLLTSYGNFTSIKEFTVHDFNEYSNHAPLTISMLLNTHIVSNSEKRYCTYRWNEVHRDIFLQTLN